MTYNKTYSDIFRCSRQRKTIKAVRMKRKITYNDTSIRLTSGFLKKPYRQGENGMICSKYLKIKTTSQEFSFLQGTPSDMRDKQKLKNF